MKKYQKKVSCYVCSIDMLQDKWSKSNPICSDVCNGKMRYNEHDERRRNLFNQGNLKYRKRIKAFLLEDFGHICQICKQTEWNDLPMPLQVDHIDGNASNNKKDNLRLICHNCDAQLPTFAGRNRGKGRNSIGLKIWE